MKRDTIDMHTHFFPREWASPSCPPYRAASTRDACPSMDQFLCYGKRLIARRLGLGDVYDRAPAMAPTELGLACLDRHSARLGEFPQKCSR